MDFSSLGQGSPLYILRQGEKPTLEVGTVKAKTQPHVKFPTQTPNLMTGLQPQQVIERERRNLPRPTCWCRDCRKRQCYIQW